MNERATIVNINHHDIMASVRISSRALSSLGTKEHGNGFGTLEGLSTLRGL